MGGGGFSMAVEWVVVDFFLHGGGTGGGGF